VVKAGPHQAQAGSVRVIDAVDQVEELLSRGPDLVDGVRASLDGVEGSPGLDAADAGV
jgi:hypothetical protein